MYVCRLYTYYILYNIYACASLSTQACTLICLSQHLYYNYHIL